MAFIYSKNPELELKRHEINRVFKFFTFSHGPTNWIERFDGWYVHGHSLEGDWIDISTTPSPRRIGRGPGTWLHFLLKRWATPTCNCKKMADYYDIGEETKNSIARHLTKESSVPYYLTWSLVACVEKLWQVYHALIKSL